MSDHGGKKAIKYYINEKGCYICTSHSTNGRGYPQISINNRSRTIARYIYTQNYGEIPKGLLVCHTCDNPLCINSNHLFLGTPQDNMDDKMGKGRGYKALGENNGHHKFTQADVLNIVKDIKAGMSLGSIAEKYHSTRRSINDIKLGNRWNWLTKIKEEMTT